MRPLGWLLALALGCSASGAPGGAGGSAGGAASGGAGAGGAGGGAGGAGAGGLPGPGGTAGTLPEDSGPGGSGGAGGGCVGVSEQATTARVPADVIFALDTSASMRVEVEAVRANLGAFSSRIAGTDARIVMLAERWSQPAVGAPAGFCMDAPLGSGRCPDDSRPPEYLHVAQKVESSDALYAFLLRFSDYRAVLRPDSMKVFVVVTDGDSAMPAQEFEEEALGLDASLVRPGLWRMFGVYSFSRCAEATAVGAVYAELVHRTGGVAGDLCRQDFAPVFDALADGVVASTSLECGWDIPPPPGGATLDPKRVNVDFTPASGPTETIGKVPRGAPCDGRGGWHYDDEDRPKRVLLCPVSCQRVKASTGGRIDLRFQCATVEVPR